MLNSSARGLARGASSLFFRPHLQKRFLVFSLQTEDATEQLKMAEELESKGKLRAAENLYKKVISENPAYEPAYQKLWGLWVGTCSLRVTEKELENFINMYETHVSRKESITTPLPTTNI